MGSSNSINKDQIINLLPHREPMLLIDELVNIVPHKSAVGIVNVKKDSFFFSGTFSRTTSNARCNDCRSFWTGSSRINSL